MTVWAAAWLYDDTYETGVGIYDLYASRRSAMRRAIFEATGKRNNNSSEVNIFESFEDATKSCVGRGVAVFPMGVRE